MNSSVSMMPGNTPARNKRPIEVSVAMPSRMKVIDGGIAAPAHFRNAHLADRRAARRRRAGKRGEHRARAEVGNHQSARKSVKPAVEGFVEILAGRRGADGGAHHHEHRNRNQREVVQPVKEGLRNDVQRTEALKNDNKGDRERSKTERNRRAG
jgi:hypothetical protein